MHLALSGVKFLGVQYVNEKVARLLDILISHRVDDNSICQAMASTVHKLTTPIKVDFPADSATDQCTHTIPSTNGQRLNFQPLCQQFRGRTIHWNAVSHIAIIVRFSLIHWETWKYCEKRSSRLIDWGWSGGYQSLDGQEEIFNTNMVDNGNL